MVNQTRLWIEEQRAASRKDALKEKEKARREAAERVAQLRPLDLAKQAADAEKAAAEKKKPLPLSLVQRRTV